MTSLLVHTYATTLTARAIDASAHGRTAAAAAAATRQCHVTFGTFTKTYHIAVLRCCYDRVNAVDDNKYRPILKLRVRCSAGERMFSLYYSSPSCVRF
jgi:hypothetical protein